MNNRRVDSDSIVIISILLLIIFLYLSEPPPHKNSGLYKLSRKKEEIIQLWYTKKDNTKHKNDSVMVSGLN